ncbi:MAG: hypothetical protein ACE5K2_08490 [Candidatus Zixiibacteriota bacterium]
MHIIYSSQDEIFDCRTSERLKFSIKKQGLYYDYKIGEETTNAFGMYV